jgi:hypothetical protein
MILTSAIKYYFHSSTNDYMRTPFKTYGNVHRLSIRGTNRDKNRDKCRVRETERENLLISCERPF